MGRELVKRAFSGQSSGESSLSSLPSAKKRPRSVTINPTIKVEVLLENFYRQKAPEKIPDIPKVILQSRLWD